MAVAYGWFTQPESYPCHRSFIHALEGLLHIQETNTVLTFICMYMYMYMHH